MWFLSLSLSTEIYIVMLLDLLLQSVVAVVFVIRINVL
jgi:hypothetical protein